MMMKQCNNVSIFEYINFEVMSYAGLEAEI